MTEATTLTIQQSYFFSIIYLTIFSYLALILIFFFILFNSSVDHLNSIELLKFIISNKFYLYSLILGLLSLMGVPPFLGFTVKLWQILFLANKLHFIIFLIFLIYNILITFFYLYTFIYIVEAQKDSIKPSRSNISSMNMKFHGALIWLNSANVFAVFYINDWLEFFYFLSTFLNM